jgi:hypothetical protein
MHRALLLAGLVAWAAPVAGSAQTAPPPPYRPGLGDLMTMTVQPRHTKLGLAGQARNWPYAAYELHELEESFERAARAWPQWRAVPIAGMIDGLTKAPMAALDGAVKAADAARFEAAYGELTAACNACHKAADRGVIVIQPPQGSPFPDQDFRPAPP